MTFDEMLQHAEAQAFKGWDFSYLQGRWEDDDLPWDYRQIVEAKLANATTLLDMGTGGGEFLSSLKPLPAKTYATEAYPPNIKVATERLSPLGIIVKAIEDDEKLPFESNLFDLVINRHEEYGVDELWRIMKPNGVFITQQVGGSDSRELNDWLEIDDGENPANWSLSTEIAAFERAGFTLLDTTEVMAETRFFDVGAVAYYAKIIEWQFPRFSVVTHREQLLKIHDHIQAHGHWAMTSHRFLIVAQKPKK
jgi:SAM-dependent methyltransferase